MKKKRRRNNASHVTIIILLIVTTLGIAAAAAVLYIQKQSQAGAQVASDSLNSQDDDDLVTYNGKKYRYNTHLSNYLLLGIDTADDITEDLKEFGGRRSDSIFLLSYDRKEETVRALSIPRDTITMVTVYNEYGDNLGQFQDHLSLQYAYGDGKETSCKMTRDTVSKMLYDVPIIGYTAISLDSIPLLVDTVGGVTLTLPDDSMKDVNPEYTKGTVITLNGENAESYLRYRNLYYHDQALVRMERQKSFINAFTDKVLKLQSQDPHTITDIYETLKPHMVTNMSNDIYLDLAGAKRQGEIQTLPGKGVATDEYDEYHLDDKALYELVLDVFYKEES